MKRGADYIAPCSSYRNYFISPHVQMLQKSVEYVILTQSKITSTELCNNIRRFYVFNCPDIFCV